MLQAIIRFSIRNKFIVGLFTVALIVSGVFSLTKLPIDAVPDITNNQVQIITSAPSSGAEDIERLVTFPIEQTMATIPDIIEIRSFSRFGLSVVTIVFEDGVDIYWARQQVNERLVTAKEQIPEGLGTPELAPVTTGLGEIFQYIIHPKKGYEDKYNAMELRTIQDWIVRRQLLGTKGVADVSSFGGHLKQYEVSLNTDKLRSLQIDVATVLKALEANNQNAGGAYIERKPNTYFIRTEGLIKSIEDIENIVVSKTKDGFPILIKNIGEVKFGSAIRYGAMTRNDEGEVVGAMVLMLKDANSSEVIKQVKQRIAQIEKTLPEGVVIEPFLDRTNLVNSAIGTVSKNLIEGALIVVFVLVLMLGNFRAGLVVASVIPLSMLFAITLMNLFGVSGNLMSLGAIDFGLIVDGAVIIVEATMHIFGLKKINHTLHLTERNNIVEDAATKIMKSAVFGQVIILIVYMPILALVGIEGKMFKPMALTVSFAIIGASILSVTYVPMISSLVLRNSNETKTSWSDRLMQKLQTIYQKLFDTVMQKKKLVITSVVVLFVGSIALFTTLGGEFIPSLDEGDFAVEVRLLTGSSLDETVEVTQKVSRVLLDNFPEVKEVVGKIGSAEIPTDPMPIEACDLMVILKPKKEWTSAKSKEELAEKMQQKLKENFIGVVFGFQQPIQLRFNELMTGARQDVVLKVYGEDLNQLALYAKQVGAIVEKTQGTTDVFIERTTGLPQIMINYHRDKIAQYGLNIKDINETINAAFAGQSAGLVFENERRFDLVVRLEKTNRSNIDDVKNLYITTPNGNQIPLYQLADIKLEMGPNQIQRDDAKRRVVVGFNIRNDDVQSVVNRLKENIEKELKFASGYYITYGGSFKNFDEAKARLYVAVPVALGLIFILLYFTFHSLIQAFIIFTAIPLSAIGGIAALWFRDMPFSISAGVGFIALFGVSVLNGIVLINEFNYLKKTTELSSTEIAKIGSINRLRPVLMTALVASLGFLPMAVSQSSGAEVQKPLATVVIGGLVSATFLTLFILPILYLVADKIKLNKAKYAAAILVVLGFSLQTNAQTKIGLSKAIEIAISNNPKTVAAELQVKYRQALKKSSTEIPKTEVSLMQGQYNSYHSEDNNVTLTQSLPFPTFFGAQNKLNNLQIKSAQLQQQVTRNELVLEVKKAYNQLQFLYQMRKLLVQTDSIFEQFEKAATARYTSGEATLMEKSTAILQAMEAKNKLKQLELQINSSMTQFNTLLNGNTFYSITDYEFLPILQDIIIDSLWIQNNLDLQVLNEQINVANQEKRVEVNRSLPDISIGYFSQTLIGTENHSNNSIAGANTRFQGFTLGVALPLWYLPTAAKIKAGALQASIAKKNYENMKNIVQKEYLTGIAVYKQAQVNLEYYTNAALPNANLLLKQAQVSYKNGEVSYNEFLQAIRSTTDIKQNYWLAIKEYNDAVFTLQYLQGKK